MRRRDPQSGKIDHNRQHLCSQSVGCWRLASRRDDDVLNKQLLWNIKGREGEESTLKESENWMGWTSPNISGQCPVGWTSCQELVIFFTGRKHYWRTSLSTACRWKCNTLISKLKPFQKDQSSNQLPRIANSSCYYCSVTKNLVGHISGPKRATGDPLVSKRPDF